MPVRPTTQNAERYFNVVDQLGPEDDPRVRRNLMAMREAVAIADLPDAERQKKMGELSPDETAIVTLLHEVRQNKNGEGYRDTNDAAAKDVWIAINNNINAGGYYNVRNKLIAIPLKRDKAGENGAYVYDWSDSRKWTPWIDRELRDTLHHEVEHFEQYEIKKISDPPAGLRPIDQKIWSLALEAEAVLHAKQALREDAKIIYPDSDNAPELDDPEVLRTRFFEEMHGDSFHKEHYKISEAGADQGRPMTAKEFSDAFGHFPTINGNFLENSFQTAGDLEVSVLEKKDASSATLAAVFKYATHPVDFRTMAALQALDGREGVKVVMMPDGQHGLVIKPAGDHEIAIDDLQRTQLADGTSGYRTIEHAKYELNSDNSTMIAEPNWLGPRRKDYAFITIKQEAGRIDAAVARHSFNNQDDGIGYVYGTGALLARPVEMPVTQEPMSGDAWTAAQRIKTVNLGYVFSSNAATKPAPASSILPQAETLVTKPAVKALPAYQVK